MSAIIKLSQKNTKAKHFWIDSYPLLLFILPQSNASAFWKLNNL